MQCFFWGVLWGDSVVEAHVAWFGGSLNSFTVTGGWIVGRSLPRRGLHDARDEMCMRSCFSGIRRWTGLGKGPKPYTVLAKLCDLRETAEPLLRVGSASRRWKAR